MSSATRHTLNSLSLTNLKTTYHPHTHHQPAMTRAFGFDGDSAAHEALERKVREDEAAKRQASESAARERRASMGLPEDEHKTRSDKKKERDADPARKKSIGEKVANFVFNGGRSSKAQNWGEERIGNADGRVERRES